MKQYRVMNTSDYETTMHEYDIIVREHQGETTYTMTRSYSDHWAKQFQGTEVMSIYDDGNGYMFPKNMYSQEVGYAEGAELMILLNFINKSSRQPLFVGEIEEYEVTNKYSV
jgi:hypothetical protein